MAINDRGGESTVLGFIEDPEQREWLQQHMEASRNRLALGHEEQRRILTKLSDAEIFEQFIQRSYGAGACDNLAQITVSPTVYNIKLTK